MPPPNLDELQEFKQGLVKIVENIQFSKHTNPLQEKMKEDIKVIKSSEKLLIGADKTTNFYKVKPELYEKLLKENITKEYKKAKPVQRQDRR